MCAGRGADNELGGEGTSVLAAVLVHMRHLVWLDLSGACFAGGDAVLPNARSVRGITANGLQTRGAVELAPALTQMDALEQLLF